MYGFADLHTHTTASDGIHAPADMVRMAVQAGLSGIAITDHDTVAGIEEALQEGATHGIVVVPGIEISTQYEGKEIHVIGYYMDHRDLDFLRFTEGQRNSRNRRNELIVERLNELGHALSMEDVIVAAGKEEGSDETVGRPHIAAALVRKGYVASIQQAFELYLAEGAAAFVNSQRANPAEAVQAIRRAGGAAVLAHPGLYRDDALLVGLISSGIVGIEVWHPDHSAQDEQKYLQFARDHSLIATGGSDFHGSREGAPFHGQLGARRVCQDILAELFKAKSNRN